MVELDSLQHSNKIDGPGCIVEIDEAKIGKRKYNRGRLVDGHWILGMIERGSGGRFVSKSVQTTNERCPQNLNHE